MESNISKYIVSLYKQYLFGQVYTEVTDKGKTLYIKSRQYKGDITYESRMFFDITVDKPILKKLSFEIHDYSLDNDIIFKMESNTGLYMHDTLMTILDTVLNMSLKVERIIYFKYGSTKE